jgi:hypothetical protein
LRITATGRNPIYFSADAPAVGSDWQFEKCGRGAYSRRDEPPPSAGPEPSPSPTLASTWLTFHRKVIAETLAFLVRLGKVAPPGAFFFAMTETPSR